MKLKTIAIVILGLLSFNNLTAIAADKRSQDASRLIMGLTTLNNSDVGKRILEQNLNTTIAINNNSSAEERNQALYDNTVLGLLGSLDNGLIVADAFAGKMKEIFFENTSIKIDPKTYQNVGKSFSPNFKALFMQVNSMIGADNDFAKNYFATGIVNGQEVPGLALPEGGIFGAYDEAYKEQVANGGHPNGVGNVRPAQISPDSIVIFEGTDFFGKPASSYDDAIKSIENSPAYPSGHSALGFSSTLLFAQLVPEQYQDFIARGGEFGNSRVVLGVHHTLDVIGARIMTTYALAQMLNNNPDYTNQEIHGMVGNSMTTTNDFQGLLAAAQKDLRGLLEQGCQMSIAECKAAAPKKSKEELAKERQDYLDRLTYGLDPIGDTTLEAVVPEGAEVLIATRYPYLNKEQRREILRTTMIESGHALDDGSGWARLNLYDAGGGYGALEQAVIIDMNAALGGLNAYDEWNNNITGSGSLEKRGTGVLELSGDSTYTGPTTVSGGGLIVTGSLISDIIVKSPGIFQGSGTVGSVTAEQGSVIATSKDGDLNIVGDLSLNGATYLVTISEPIGGNLRVAGETADINGITVGGNITLTDATLALVAPIDNIQNILGKKLQVLSGASVTGRFNQEDDFLLLDSLLEYQPNAVNLTLQRNGQSLAMYANNPNGASVALAVENLADTSLLYNHFLAAKDRLTVANELSQLSGKVYADVVSATMKENQLLRDQLQLRLSNLHRSTNTNNRAAIWGDLFGNWGKVKDKDQLEGFKHDTQGILLGTDFQMESMTWGVAAGYSKSRMKWDSRPNVDQNNYHLALYGETMWDQWKLNAGLGYSWHKADVDRSVNIGNIMNYYSNDFKLSTTQLFADLGYQMSIAAGTELEPFVNLAYVNVKNKGLSEGFGSAALDIKGENHHYLSSIIGIRFNSQLGSEASPFHLNGTLGWQHQFNDIDREVRARFSSGSQEFVNYAVPASRDGAVVKLGLSYDFSRNSQLDFNYQGILSKNSNNHNLNLGVRIEL